MGLEITRSTVEPDDTTRGVLDDAYQQALRSRAERDYMRRQPPLVRLWAPSKDLGLELRGRVTGEYSANFQWRLNDTGSGELVLPAEHHLARWLTQWWTRGQGNAVVTVDKDGARWSGICSEVTTSFNDDQDATVTATFLHDYEQLKHLLVWPNPFTPAGVQFPKTWQLYGPAAYILKVTLFVNLFRQFGSLWQLPDDPLNPKTWVTGLNYKQWPILVRPRSIVRDSTPWRYLHARFTPWHDMAEPLLDDCRLMVQLRRWFIGDPQPWPGAGLNRNGQIIVDIVDKSGWWEQTATGGTIAHGLVRTGLEVADNAVDEIRTALDRPVDADEYSVSGFLGVAPKQPWVVYRVGGDTNTAVSAEYTFSPATVGQITVGGRSAPGVNEAMSASSKLLFNLLGSFILQPGLGSVVDTALAPLYEDTLLAFMSLKSPLRTRQLGWGHYMENFQDGGDQAYTLSSLLAMRKGFFETKAKIGHTIRIADGAPYLIGENGKGHFFLGDRIGSEAPATRDGHVDVAQVTELVLSWQADQPHEWEATIGEFPEKDPLEWALNRIRSVSAGLQEMGLL